MSSKQASVRPLGQRSIPSTFLFRSGNRSSDCKQNVDIKASNEKGSKISLSEFLNRKLNRSSAIPKSVQGKEGPFSLAIACEDVSSCAQAETIGKKRSELDKDLSLDIVLQQFKESKREKKDANASASNELLSRGRDEKPESRKRIRVLGDDSGPKRRKKIFSRKEPIPLFNHYANGGGWWDHDMEGVDNEEVGCSDVWEGMGCTTLGGLDWH